MSSIDLKSGQRSRAIHALSLAAALLTLVGPAQAQNMRGPSSATFEATPQQMVGTYMAHTFGDTVVVAEGSKLIVRFAQFTNAPLVPLGGGRYQLDDPKTKGWVAQFRPGTFAANSLELFVIQADGTQGTFPKRAPAPLAPELAEYESLIGHYVAGQAKGEIVNLGGRLAFYEHGWPAFPLRPAGRDVLDMTSAPGTGEFKLSVRREGGEVQGFVLKQPNRVSEYVKAGAVQQMASADQVRAKRIEAGGGEAALKARRTLAMESEVIMGNISGTTRSWRKLPFASANVVTIALPDNKSFVVRTRFDGTKGVEVATDKAPKGMSQSDIDWDMVDSPHEPLLWSRLYKSVTVVGNKQFDNRNCIALAKTFNSGLVVIEYIDAATMLPAGIEGPRLVEGKEVASTTIFRDWRSVAGVRLPFVQIVRQGEINVEARLTSARWDTPMSDTLFLVKDAPAPRPRK